MYRISNIVIAVAVMIITASCVKTEDPASGGGISDGGGTITGELVEMTFQLTTTDMSRPTTSIPLEPTGENAVANATAAAGVARANSAHGTDGVMTVTMDAPVTRAETDPDENKITGLWVLQFESTAPEAKLISREYYAAEYIINNEIAVSFIEAKGDIRAYFIANVGENHFKTLPLETTTLSAFETMDFDFAPATPSDITVNGLPMVGVYNGLPSAMGGTISLTRMVAKIDFTCKVDLTSAAESFAVKEVQLVSAATFSAYVTPDVPTGTTGLYPDSSQAENFVDGTLETENQNNFSRTWYISENLRGIVADLTESKRGMQFAPAGSTYIEVTGEYTKAGELFEVAYRIYPGKNKTDNFNIERNYIYTLTSTIKGMNESDLRVEVKRGENLSANGTANCYMVHKAGAKYRFDATVMGNGKPTAEFTYGNYTAPAITPEELKPASAIVLWETGEKGSVILDEPLKVSKGEVYFSTAGDEDGNVVEGNAVIGVFNSEGTLIWSWHIWSTKYDPDDEKNDYDTLVNYQKKTYYSMKYNLGANASKGYNAVPESYGLLYQWGRKDPFIGAKSVSSTNYDYADTSPYDDNYDWKNVTTSSAGSTPIDIIKYVIQNPTHFIISSGASVNDWVATDRSKQLDNLWGNPNDGEKPNDQSGDKSIYDPCPVGWRVPPQDTWTGFTTDGQNADSSNSSKWNVDKSIGLKNGWNFYTNGQGLTTTFFPAAGMRLHSLGSLNDASTVGYYWSSSPYSSNDDYAGYLSFSLNHIHPLNYSDRAYGFSIRCVRDMEDAE